MNNSKFVQTEGYPLNAERLQELQTSFSVLNSLGNLAGNLTIISGCELVGATVKNGVIFINSEILEFRTASVNANSRVIIIEETISKPFKNGVVKQVYTNRYATFGTAETSWTWANFKRPIETKAIPIDIVSRLEVLEKKNAVFQAGGGMVLWNKPAAQIPAGWQEVVDWRGRMPVGFDSSQTEFNAIGKTGGAKNKLLSIAEIPAIFFVYQKIVQVGKAVLQYDAIGNREGASYEAANTNTVGGGQTFSLLNPYRVVLFIEYIG